MPWEREFRANSVHRLLVYSISQADPEVSPLALFGVSWDVGIV